MAFRGMAEANGWLERAGRAEEADRFLGVITGAVPMSDFFTPQNLMRVVGLRGMTSLALSRAPAAARRPRRARRGQRPLTEKCWKSVGNGQRPPHPQLTASNARTSLPPDTAIPGRTRSRSRYGLDATCAVPPSVST